jgi:hypothetical protein
MKSCGRELHVNRVKNTRKIKETAEKIVLQLGQA